MVMSRCADLHELDFPAKMINDLLVALRVPPLDGEIIFAASSHDPVWNVTPCQLMHLRIPRFLLSREMDIAMKCRWRDGKPQSVVQKCDEPVQTMIRSAVAFVD